MTANAAGPTAAPLPSVDAAISVRNLVKRYRERAVVDRVSLDVARGEIVALLGPNGAGKTTTVEIVEGYRRADSGEVRVLGLDPQRDASTLRPRVGLMLQSGGVYTYGRPRELLHLFASFYANAADPDALLAQVGLEEAADRPWRLLSGGERQRVSLALALIGRPEVAILDEPTAGMDPAARAETRRLIGNLRRDGVAVLLTTHDLGDVEALADRVAIVARGRLVAQGTPASLASVDATGATGRDVIVRFARPLTADEVAALSVAVGGAGGPGGAARVTADGMDSVRIADGAKDPAITALVATWAADRGLAIVTLGSGQPSLETRYLALVGREAATEPEHVAPATRSTRRRRGR